jgi:REP element-mobilizing transposase RayT
MLPDCTGLRRGPAYAALRAALVRANSRGVMRVCHYSLQGNHVHLVCEAPDARTLSRGVRGLLISLARRLNAQRARRGRVFADRYHSHAMKTPSEVRNVLSYVLNNWRRHGEHERQRTWHIDPYSSACWFDGWTAPLRAGPDARPRFLGETEPIPVAPPQFWLLQIGWRRRGLVSHTEQPGPLEQARKARRGA